jgi:DNA primase
VKVPKSIINLAKRKETTAFLDGDRGGDLILKELMQVAKPKYVARAPRNKEVEDLSPEEIKEALAKKVDVDELKTMDKVMDIAGNLRGTLEAVLLRKNGSQMSRVPVSDLVDKLKESKNVDMVIFDGIITGRLVDAAVEKGVSTLIGDRVAEKVMVPSELEIKSFKEL